ncbi:MAG: ThiF family adenylyltransferase [Eubacteriales bacterium]|nr:ThiF family adenylyltransferase [Eubacteriales bacterium]
MKQASGKNANLFIDKSVVLKINQMIHRDPYRECGGLLIGNISMDPITEVHTIHVSDLYYEERFGSGSTFEFTTDYKMNAFKYVLKNCPNEHIIGNVHSHAQFQAFWSATDREMMMQTRDNSIYIVVSPSHGNWEAVFKDFDFNFHDCDVRIADSEHCEHMFTKCITKTEGEEVLGGKKVKRVGFHATHSYTDAQKREFDKRFLHSISELEAKKILIVGAGTIGNLLAEYAMNCGIGNITIVDMDAYEYWNLPRSSMIDDRSLGKPKAPELARAVAERCSFTINVTGINADICNLGWGFFKDFDLVLSPVDSAAIRQYIDRGCKLYHVPHITCGTGNIGGEFTGNVLSFPANSVVDLEYVWGNGYRSKLDERKSCSDISEETQAQVMGFSAQIAGITMDLALKYLLGKTVDDTTAWKYVLNSVGTGYERDKEALRIFKYGRLPKGIKSELFDVLESCSEVPKIYFDRTHPKGELWEQLEELFHEDCFSYGLNLEWSLNIPIAYVSTGAYSRIEVMKESGDDPVLMRLPKQHVYLVESETARHPVELIFTENG